jgi:energy-coupling factor transport system substrate-specific component
MTKSTFLSTLILLLASWLGLWAFIYPFFLPEVDRANSMSGMGMAHANDAPLIFILLLGLCLVVIIANLETRRMDARLVAVLGVVVGINAVLRLVPGPLGFSLIFFLPILCGYVFGADFGFLMGALSLLVSGLITAGTGPWLPFQMFAAGWVGLVGGWLPHFARHPRLELLLLAAWGALSGFLYGAVMNLWFWPYLAAPVPQTVSEQTGPGMFWQAGIGFWSTLVRYTKFYVTTSLWWDAGRAFGNLLLILLVGAPILRLLYRFRHRFRFTVKS